MTNSKIYSNGYRPDQQQAANRRYNARQRQIREWVDRLVPLLGAESREELIKLDPQDIASAYRHYLTK